MKNGGRTFVKAAQDPTGQLFVQETVASKHLEENGSQVRKTEVGSVEKSLKSETHATLCRNRKALRGCAEKAVR